MTVKFICIPSPALQRVLPCFPTLRATKSTIRLLSHLTLFYRMHEKQKLAVTFGELVYNGQWFTPLREALSAFVTKTQEHVTGTVRLKLYKGNMINAGVWSPYSLYSEEIATFGESDYNQADATGFINLYGLPIAVQAKVDGKSM